MALDCIARDAVPDDVEDILVVMEAGFTEAGWQDFDHYRARNFVNQVIRDPMMFGQVLEADEKVVGGMIGMVSPMWWQYADMAQDIITYVYPAYRGHGLKLIRNFRQWADDFGTVEMVQVSSSFPGEPGERTKKLYARMGFQQSVGVFIERK